MRETADRLHLGFCNIPLAMAGLFLIAATAIARPLPQEPAPPAVPPVAPAAAPPNAPADVKPAAETDDSSKELNEQTIYIPYEKLRAVFEKEGRGVFLPYEKFQALWEAAQKHSKQAAPPKVPVSAVIRAIDSQAKIGKQTVDVEAALEIELIGKGWITVPLRLRQSAIRSAIIDGKSARVVFDAAKGYSLLHHKQTSTSETLKLSLNYSRTFTKAPGKSDVAFEPPQSPINRWLVSIPEKDVTLEIEPLIAATRISEAAGEPGNADAAPAESKLLAFVGAAQHVRIRWNPRAEGAAGLEAFATVQVNQQVQVAKGVIRTAAQLNYEISRASLSKLEVDLPPDYKIINVYEKNVRRWDVEMNAGRQRVQVELFEPVQGRQSLSLELEKFRDAAEEDFDVAVPMIRALGVGRQQGFLLANLEAGLHGESISRVGLLQVDSSELPVAFRKQAWEFAYRYGAVPYELKLHVETVQPRISVAELIEVSLSEEAMLTHWRGKFLIQDAGVFQLRVDLPDGFEVRAVRGEAVANGVVPVAVESYHRENAESSTWVINLSKKAIGNVGLFIELWKRLQDPNLTTPTGKTSQIPVDVPRATSKDLFFSEGALVLRAPESLRVNPDTSTGMHAVSFPEAFQVVGRGVPNGIAPAVLAFAFAQGDVEFAVAVQRRQPLVTVQQVLHTKIEPGVVKYTATFFYSVRYSGVRSLRVDVPTSIADKIRKETQKLRRSTISPAPEDVEDGYTAWSFAAETELLGSTQLQLTWEENIEELKIGSSRNVKLPRLIPREVNRAQGQILVSKAEGIDIEPAGKPSGVRPIDPEQDVYSQAKKDGVALAFEFVGDWSLDLLARRYEPAPGKLTSIDRGLLRVVVLPNNQLSVQAIYRVKSASQRLAIQLPENFKFDHQPLKIDGAAVSPEQDSKSTIFVPLVDQDPEHPFLIELRYGLDAAPGHIEMPSFPGDPAVQKIHLALFVPHQLEVLGSSGPWTYQLDRPPFFWEVDPYGGDPRVDNLLGWVSEGHPAGLNGAKSFPVGQSRRYVYSTLRPAPPPDGDIGVVITSRVFFQGGMIAILALVGLPFFGRSMRSQVVLLLLIATVSLLIGLFQSEFIAALMHGGYPASIGVLALIWTAGHVWKIGGGGIVRFRKRKSTVESPAETDSQPQTELDEPVIDAEVIDAEEIEQDRSEEKTESTADDEDDLRGTDDDGGLDHDQV